MFRHYRLSAIPVVHAARVHLKPQEQASRVHHNYQHKWQRAQLLKELAQWP